ncbi:MULTISPECIES: hypothetical protein [unclassified Polaromonas]|jgi:hypothetical protein|uniref:hypothetical protein n=1 Tax=unclassified Polaromonas TaxID=2638319 RepID=UPI000BC960FB|nr:MULTISPECIES: hypothetical protein [unclassified Polaromonas]OYY37068.1 MAG: hypothetical protein B7Y60_08840 [Polaromonas sp. 35-63-35]OYZ13599.1 MAG: hypothetical protein B7Y28_23495 [Polaromonas sp. 16-63-31]OYZ78824.1 MAG: hypothetical protein B7Y09_11105 [Polaromonas sp. 24-63-21]OZA49662.1 MAG: hypothetical protein B7X88_14725 [Polaromonas sp. 17-63-33]OZA86794.1 MAG: hypothetical protein B7X65_15095 [Polaromonas sp. 39-63-25]
MNTKFVAAAQAIAEHFKAAEARRGEPFAETFIDPMNNDAVTPNTAGIPVDLLRALVEARDPAPDSLRVVLCDVESERQRQDAKWGGPEHDDGHDTHTFCLLIEGYTGWARVMAGMNSLAKARHRLVQVAALAVAGCESIDRAITRAASGKGGAA